MLNLNKVIIAGRLGKEPDTRQTQSGATIVNLSVATTERFKDNSGKWSDKTEWHRVVAFGPRADAIAKYLRKGSPVFIEGYLQTRKWEDKKGNTQYTTEVIMKEFQFLDSRTSDKKDESQESFDIHDEDIPF